MSQEIINIIQSSKVTQKTLETRLSDPIKNKEYPQRYIFVLLKKYISDFYKQGTEPRMLGLAGLRGVGKTTLMWQLAKFSFNNVSKNIYAFNINALTSLGYSTMEVLEVFQNDILQQRFREYTEPIIFMFDEVHDDENWAKTLKIIYDECRTAFVIATGSSALLINQTADLATRMKIEKIYPFKFTEFIVAKSLFKESYTFNHPEYGKAYEMLPAPKEIAKHLKQALFFSESYEHLCNYLKKYIVTNSQFLNYFTEVEKVFEKPALEAIKEYVSYHNIPRYSLYQNKGDIYASILELVKRIVYEDVARTQPDYTGTQYEKLLYRLAASDEVNPDKLSSTLGMKKEELEKAISILDRSELINLIMPHTQSIDAKLNKNKKSFFMSPSIRRALLATIYGSNVPEAARSKMWEDIVVMYLCRVVGKSFISFSSEKEGINPDFIIETRDMPILLEVGTRKTTTKQISQYKKEIRYGIVVNAAATQPIFIDKDRTLILPLAWFLML